MWVADILKITSFVSVQLFCEIDVFTQEDPTLSQFTELRTVRDTLLKNKSSSHSASTALVHQKGFLIFQDT